MTKTVLKCAWVDTCQAAVTHVDSDGYIYCARHGRQRKAGGVRCRTMTSAEVKRLQRGEPLAGYSATSTRLYP